MKFVLTAAAAALLTTAAPARAGEATLIDALNAMSVPLAYHFVCTEKFGDLDVRILESLVSAAERRGYSKTDETQRKYLAQETASMIKVFGNLGATKMCLETKVSLDEMSRTIDRARR